MQPNGFVRKRGPIGFNISAVLGLVPAGTRPPPINAPSPQQQQPPIFSSSTSVPPPPQKPQKLPPPPPSPPPPPAFVPPPPSAPYPFVFSATPAQVAPVAQPQQQVAPARNDAEMEEAEEEDPRDPMDWISEKEEWGELEGPPMSICYWLAFDRSWEMRVISDEMEMCV
jgi:hypothetical protein